MFHSAFSILCSKRLPKSEIRGTLHNKASLKGLKCGKSFSLALRSNLEQQRWATKMFLLLAAGQIYSFDIVNHAGNKGICSMIKVERTSRALHVDGLQVHLTKIL